MRSAIVAAGLFATAAFASPFVKRDYDPCDDGAAPCLSFDDATTVAAHFAELITDYSDAAADEYLTPDFHDYSDSVNELINGACNDGPAPLGSATFSSRDEFKAGQGAQPPIPFEIVNLWHTCDTVIIRWQSAQEPQLVTGISVLETAYVDGEFDIQTVYAEFNSGSWLVNLGVFQGTCPAPPAPTIEVDKRDSFKRSLDLRHLRYLFE